ncbi:MAG: glycoside hydrolase family 10 protein, partial [Candidatus Promineifilaceae bacterium]
TGCTPPPHDVPPPHKDSPLEAQQGPTDGKLNAAQWDINGNIICEPYLRASPASIPFDDHLRAVVKELAQKYDVDGIHLDHIRYAGSASSCDPVSEERYGAPCDDTTEYADWQRQQIDGTVEKLYTDLSALDREIWLSAAVWPVYQDNFGWGVKGGFDTYYQDSKAWLAGQYIDSISPMIYTGSPNCSGPYFWTRERWSALVADFQNDNAGRYVIPGIGVDFCTDDDFAEITARIEEARRLGTAGHAIFSYSGLKDRGFFEKLANGPYAQPASVPPLPWH